MCSSDLAQSHAFTHADTLRGSYTTSARAWWDVTFYDLRVTISPTDSSIRGSNGISYRVLQPASEMQIDLMVPLEVDSMVQDGRAVPFRRDGNAFFARLAAPQPAGATKTITVFYHGKPQPARRPPWDGGFTWTNDSLGRAWRMGTTGAAIGVSGMKPLRDRRGESDLFGRELQATVIGVADEIAAAASLVIGEAAEGIPAAIVRGAVYDADDAAGIGELLRPLEKDLFR